MKIKGKTVLTFVAFVLLVTGFIPQIGAEENKIGYADFLVIYHSYYKTKQEDTLLKKEGDSLQKEIDKDEEKIKILEKKIESGLLTEEKKKEIENQIKEKREALMKKARKLNFRMSEQRRKVVEELVIELRKKVQTFGTQEKYKLILDGKDLIYADTALDITRQIVDYINQDQPVPEETNTE